MEGGMEGRREGKPGGRGREQCERVGRRWKLLKIMKERKGLPKDEGNAEAAAPAAP